MQVYITLQLLNQYNGYYIKIDHMTELLLILITPLLIFTSYYYQTQYILKNFMNYHSVSHMYSLQKFRNNFKKGLIFTGILQILWIFLIIVITNIGIHPGHLIFLVGAIGSTMMGFFSLKERKYIHAFGTGLYFLGLSTGAFLLTLQIPNQFNFLFIIALLHFIVWILSIPFYYPKKNGAFAIETLHVLLSYSWLLLITSTILLS